MDMWENVIRFLKVCVVGVVSKKEMQKEDGC